MEHYLQALMPKDSQESDQGWFAKAVGAVSSDVEATFRLFVILNSLSTQVEIASSVSGIVSISSTWILIASLFAFYYQFPWDKSAEEIRASQKGGLKKDRDGSEGVSSIWNPVEPKGVRSFVTHALLALRCHDIQS